MGYDGQSAHFLFVHCRSRDSVTNSTKIITWQLGADHGKFTVAFTEWISPFFVGVSPEKLNYIVNDMIAYDITLLALVFVTLLFRTYATYLCTTNSKTSNIGK